MAKKSSQSVSTLSPFLTASLLGGLIGGGAVLITGAALLKAGVISSRQKPSYAIVDTQKILKEKAQALMGSSKSAEEAEAKIEPLIAQLDLVMSQLSQEEGVVLLQPQAVAGFHVWDLTEDVKHRLSSLGEGRGQ